MGRGRVKPMIMGRWQAKAKSHIAHMVKNPAGDTGLPCHLATLGA
jgi:hypothetical protein